MDISSKRKSRGILALRHQIEKLGEEAYEKYGCNFIAFLVEGRPSKPSMIYESPGVTEFLDAHARDDVNLVAPHVQASRGKVSSRGHSDSNLSSDPDLDSTFGDTDDSNQSRDPDPDFARPINKPLRSYIRRPYFINAKKAIVNEANKAGVDIHWSLLPWKRLPNVCAKFGVYIDNYPDGLTSPFDSVPYDLGLGGLSDDEHEALIHALKREKMYPMRFLCEENGHDIMNNRFPALIYAPPPPDSPRSRSKRIFLDGTYDYEGHHQVKVVERQSQKRRCGRPRNIIYQNIQELESFNSVQHSVTKRRLNESYAHRPEKRIRSTEA